MKPTWRVCGKCQKLMLRGATVCGECNQTPEYTLDFYSVDEGEALKREYFEAGRATYYHGGNKFTHKSFEDFERRRGEK